MSKNSVSLPKRLLVANRGEIAVRIIRGAADLGIPSVAVFPSDDATSLHVAVADESVELQGRGVAAYLDAEQIVDAAVAAGCDAIHPGYGFLSENVEFARLCAARDICFVGPGLEALELLGDKAKARQLAAKIGVPVLPGTQGATSLEEAHAFFTSLGEGAAVMLKAVAGGGGRGIRVVERLEDLDEGYRRCASEAEKAFGSSAVYVEQLVRTPRHIEVQIVGDGTGAVSHLWERECTVQRRHQKLVEIAPSPWITEATRDALLDHALHMASEIRYSGLGTFEFLVDVANQERIAFIEANPRLQVEHTVTEEVTGLDLVAIQLQLAGGASLDTLSLNQTAIPVPRGYAIQVRINMETMGADGQPRPGSGTIDSLELPSGPGVRVDTFAYTGYRTSASFDSLLAKLICHSPSHDFNQALRKTIRVLGDFHVHGVPTNLAFLARLLGRPEFSSGDLSTRFVDQKIADLVNTEGEEASARKSSSASLRSSPDAAEQTTAAIPDGDGAVIIRAPMVGVVVSIDVQAGVSVRAGERVCVLESMKMEHAVFASSSGQVRSVQVAAGDSIGEGEPLVLLESDGADLQEIGVSELGQDAEPVSEGVEAALVDSKAWQPDLEELTRRLDLAVTMGGEQGIARQRERGKLTVRERTALLADPGSFQEILTLVGNAKYEGTELKDFTPKPKVEGSCLVEGRKIFVSANDFSVRGGEFGGGLGQETNAAMRALEWQLPYVRLIDGFGGSVASFEQIGRTYVPDGNSLVRSDVALLDKAPVASAILGIAAGLPAVQVCLSHFSVMVKGISQVFPGGPPVVKAAMGVDITKEELGGWELHTRISGVVDNVADTEAEAIEQVRRFLSYLPANVSELAPRSQIQDPIERPIDEVLSLVPNNRRRPYDARRLIELVVDQDSFFEIAPDYGRSRVTGLARVGGVSMGVMANNSLHGGATGVAEGEKIIRLIRLCDTFHLPIVSFANEPGFRVGIDEEHRGIERAGARLVMAVSQSKMPWITFVVGKLFGVGGQCHHRPSGMFQRYVWPTARWGSMHIEGGASAAYRREIESAPDPEARRLEIEARLQALASPFKTAEATGQDIISPVDTRRLLGQFADDAWRVIGTQMGSAPIPYYP